MTRLPQAVRQLVHVPGIVSGTKAHIDRLQRNAETANELLGKLHASRVASLGPHRELVEAEFRVYSQWGDDGIIQYLIRNVAIPSESFVEFGVEDYTEANTRFLLVNDNWRGLIMDGSRAHMESVRNSDIYWRHDLTAIDAFITRENINELIKSHGFAGPLGILSIDIDGNDYWVWDAIQAADPAIVIVEYNSVFGPTAAVTVPYRADFQRGRAHSSNLFWGCSVAALCRLAERKGYAFVGCNSNGNNAYFVKASLAHNVVVKAPSSGYVMSRFRESRDERGHLTYLSGSQRLAAIAEMQVWDVERDVLVPLGKIAQTP